MTEYTEAEVVRDLAREALQPVRLEPGREYAFRGPGGSIEVYDRSDALPPRKTGLVTVTDVASFARYWAKHSDSGSEVFSDSVAATVTAVLDAHTGREGADDAYAGEGARWQEHRVVLRLKLTEPWKTWLEHDRKFMSQVDFAEFLEDNLRDLDPQGAVKAADLLEAAQSFKATVKVEFGSGTRLRSGDVTLTRIETTEPSSGKRGELKFPEEFDLLLKPYEDCDDASISARLRYRVNGDKLALGYFLNQPERVRREAVERVTDKAAAAISADIMRGHPA